MNRPHHRVCPLHGPYRTTWSFTACQAEFRVRPYLDLPGVDIGCPGRTWRADDPPRLPARLWRRLDAWTRTDKDA